MDAGEVQRRVDDINWYHSLDLGHGIVTPGGTPVVPEAAMPDVRGKRVLDIGAWDGFYSFRAERMGAAEVVALDHYAWGIDWPARLEYWNACRAQGVFPDHSRDEIDFWREELPGRRGFDLAHEVYGSKVKPVCADYMTTDLDALGTFDVVMYLGVLYHMKEPLTALERVRRLTAGVALIETEAAFIPASEDAPTLAFYAGDELNADFGNWYAPNERALHAMVRAAGFSGVTTAVSELATPRGPRWLRTLLRRPTPATLPTYRLAVYATP